MVTSRSFDDLLGKLTLLQADLGMLCASQKVLVFVLNLHLNGQCGNERMQRLYNPVEKIAPRISLLAGFSS